MTRQFGDFLEGIFYYNTKMVLSAWTWGEFLPATDNGGAIQVHIWLGYIIKNPIKNRDANDVPVTKGGRTSNVLINVYSEMPEKDHRRSVGCTVQGNRVQ
ncbi:hypothetical protein GOBAR_AA33489 [Gossypium barbadense]|uniref:Uncharacterized protein n=1 Tax=Gossypium barbadense TaxID=3634 RepID=A0A2P5W801_GOSBA|nr:hypothetical protein GOBAR_AA33489 [Gossypium barbadense]